VVSAKDQLKAIMALNDPFEKISETQFWQARDIDRLASLSPSDTLDRLRHCDGCPLHASLIMAKGEQK
jgi:hypothetical protein